MNNQQNRSRRGNNRNHSSFQNRQDLTHITKPTPRMEGRPMQIESATPQEVHNTLHNVMHNHQEHT